MKETKPKLLAKLTPIQLSRIRSLDAQVNTLGNAIERAFFRKQQFTEEVRDTYKLGITDFYINTKTGEVFEFWPEI